MYLCLQERIISLTLPGKRATMLSMPVATTETAMPPIAATVMKNKY